MTSRERVIEAINHRKPDRVPVDLGGTVVTGISATAYYHLRKALGLPAGAVTIYDLLQFTALVEDDLREVIGIDTKPLPYPVDIAGCGGNEQQLFTAPNGTPAYISRQNAWDVRPDGSVVLYPGGDKTAEPSLRMLKDGMYFDNLVERIPDFDEDHLTPAEDFKDDFSEITDETARYLETESRKLYEETEYAIIGSCPMAGLGDAGVVPGAFLKAPRGIRKLEDFLMAHLLYPEYLQEVYEMQTEMMLRNLKIYRDAVGDRIQVLVLSTADYGEQNSELISPALFRSLYKPCYKKVNDWIHQNTNWKIFYHSCGSIVNLLDDFVDMGVDILNPLQLSARGMDGKMLHEKYQKDLVFWGGGINTQETLPFGTKEEIKREVKERLALFGQDGGYIFNQVHNIVGNTKPENILAVFEAVREFQL